MKNNQLKLFLILITGCWLASCSPVKRLGENELLLKKSKISFINPEKIKKKKKLSSELSTLAKPEPNSGIFKLRLRLFHAVKEPKKEKGFKYWLKYKLGEPPTLFTASQTERNRLVMEKHLKDNGYFGAKVIADTFSRKKRVTIKYKVISKGQYTLNNIIFSDDTTSVGRLIKKYQEGSYLKPGATYKKSDLDQERLRLATLAGNVGYFDFSPDYIYYFVDTLSGKLQTDLYVEVKPNDDGTRHRIYKLDETVVFTNYDLNHQSLLFKDTVQHNAKLKIIRNKKILRTETTDRMILQNPGNYFSKKNQDASVNHLLDLGIFKFVNLKYIKKQDSLDNILDRYFYLTPDQMQDIIAEFELNNRTGGYFGTAATFSYTHKNLFYGAEKLSISLTGGVETQAGNQLGLINTLDLNLQGKYSMPRFLTPFRVNYHSGFYVPRTEVLFSNNFQNRTGFYSINKANASFGYEWRETKRVWHQLIPVDLQLVRLFDTSNDFDDLLIDNPRLEKSFENVFIGGLKYVYNFSNQNTDPRKNNVFIRGEMRLAGNVFYLINRLTSGKSTSAYELLGQPFSQFFKIQGDARFYRKFRKSNLVGRLAPGVGVAYGNSEVLPYTEQFYVGGANSIRAFRLRGLGPGSFVAPTVEGDIQEQFLDQTGDIRLEANLEYRFDLFGYLKGAVFLDAGNIWLIENSESPEGIFKFNRFLEEIGVGSGVGFRIDFDYAVIRLDLGIALRKPYLDEGFRWTFDNWNFSDRSWRRDHLNLVFAIGYPF